MVELLDAVAAAVRRLEQPGVEVTTHRGLVSQVADGRTVSVVVPHEYYVLAAPEPESLRAGVVGFGVEHPGSAEFETSALHASQLAALLEISPTSVAELERRGIAATHFPLGYVPEWDRWHRRSAVRDVDVVYLGSADPRRMGILSGAAAALAGLRNELVITPHEQVTGLRPDFLAGTDKWELLARSKVLVNLHRGEKTALEWVRVLEAVLNGCVVVTEPSDDLGPLVPGEHVVVAAPGEVGAEAAALVRDDRRRARLAEAAYDLVRGLDLAQPAALLLQMCERITPTPAATNPPVTAPEPLHHPAVWLPAPGGGPPAPPELAPVRLRARPAPTADTRLALLCTGPGRDGRAGATVQSAERWAVPVHVWNGATHAHRGAERNRLLEATDEPLVAILDSGDELLDDTLLAMADLLRSDPGLDAVLCPATYGGTLVNVVRPDAERLRRRVYLTRGYVVRRAALEAMGGFTEEPALADLVDHHFWLSLAAGGGRTGVVRRIGLALRPEQ